MQIFFIGLWLIVSGIVASKNTASIKQDNELERQNVIAQQTDMVYGNALKLQKGKERGINTPNE